MNNESEMTVLKNIVRVGTVSSVDGRNRTARVAFADKQDKKGNPLISGPLKVIQSPPEVVIQEAAPPLTVDPTTITIDSIGETFEHKHAGHNESHTHKVVVSPWLPYVGQFVLCIYLPNGESDGFVIGGI